MEQVLFAKTQFKTVKLLNQAPDSDEELEIDDDTKIILIDKQVTAVFAFCPSSPHFYILPGHWGRQ